MQSNYLEVVRQGKNEWWRYFVGMLLILIFWLVVGTVLAAIGIVVWMALNSSSIAQFQQNIQQVATLTQTPSIATYIILNLPSLCFCLGIFIVVRWLHQRPFRTLITAAAAIDWRRIGAGFGVWLLSLAIVQVPLYLWHPAEYALTFEPSQWFLLLPIALILTPIQTSAEEFFFRGYLLQGMGLLTRNRLVLCLLNGVLFGIPHFGNPEMQRNPLWIGLVYFGWGVFLALITLKDQGLELALGIHAANNLYSVLFVNTKDSAIPTMAIVTIRQAESAQVTFVLMLVLISAFYFVFFGRQRGTKRGE